MKRFELLAELIKDIKHPVGAEIGVCDGASSLYLLEHIKNIQLFCVDPYTMYQQKYDGSESRQHSHKKQSDFDAQYKRVKSKLDKFGDKVDLIRKTSVEAAEKIEDDSLDFVFIDANHLYDSVKQDILTWLPKVKVGCILLGHDYNKNDKDHLKNTCKVVDEIFQPEQLNFGADNCWWIRRK